MFVGNVPLSRGSAALGPPVGPHLRSLPPPPPRPPPLAWPSLFPLSLSLYPQVVKKSYSKAFTLTVGALFVTPKTTGAQVELSEQELPLWPSDVDKLSPSDSLPRGSRAHITLGCAEDVEAVQTGIDLLEIVRQERGGSRGEEVGELARGKLLSLGNGRWMLNLAKKMKVRAIFTGYYGKGKPVPTHGSRKGGAFQSCTIN